MGSQASEPVGSGRDCLASAEHDVTTIREALNLLEPGRPDEVTARRLMEAHGRLAREATASGWLAIAEVAMSGQTVFRRLVARTDGLTPDELRFLTNVTRALEDLVTAIRTGQDEAYALMADLAGTRDGG